jgi:transposase
VETGDVAEGKKNAARRKAHLVFVDESGFLLIPTLRRTWAHRGQTPRVYHRYRHDRYSVISGISISPVRKHVGLYFRCHRRNIRHPEVCGFLKHLLRHLRGPVTIVWDNLSVHKGPPIAEIRRRYPRLDIHFLPPYAPELNPDEGVWANAKARLANGRPDDFRALYQRLYSALQGLRQSQPRLRRCFHQSELPPLF